MKEKTSRFYPSIRGRLFSIHEDSSNSCRFVISPPRPHFVGDDGLDDYPSKYQMNSPVASASSLSPAQVNRYRRHLILPEVGIAGQQKLLDAKVLIIGAG